MPTRPYEPEDPAESDPLCPECGEVTDADGYGDDTRCSFCRAKDGIICPECGGPIPGGFAYEGDLCPKCDADAPFLNPKIQD